MAKNVSSGILKAIKRDRTYSDKSDITFYAWTRGKNPWLTVPSEKESNKKFVRVKANSLWGDGKKRRKEILELK